MSSACISSCVDDARAPVRATYVNLYKWPESDAAFVKSVGSRSGGSSQGPRVVDSISCRQMYLRSYTFSRKETMPERTKKCLGRVKERVASGRHKSGAAAAAVPAPGSQRRRGRGMRRAKEASCAALFVIFRRLLLCAATVDVADGKD